MHIYIHTRTNIYTLNRLYRIGRFKMGKKKLSMLMLFLSRFMKRKSSICISIT